MIVFGLRSCVLTLFQLPGTRPVVALGLSSCGAWAPLPHGIWNPPGPGIEPVSPALPGRLSTPGPPVKHILKGSSKNNFFKINCHALLIFHLKIQKVFKMTSYSFLFFFTILKNQMGSVLKLKALWGED